VPRAEDTAISHDVRIRPWAEGDLDLLQRLLGDPAVMVHLGGPETAEAIGARHRRYLDSDDAPQGLFAIVSGPQDTPIGWVGFWPSSWQGEDVLECGWHVLAEHQGRGLATAGAALMIERARATHSRRHLHAFPSLDNAASNSLCLALGFRLLGEADVEYPRGHVMHSNDWRLDLW
jgi:RimJ/RimL family protein N-acetyltransferase